MKQQAFCDRIKDIPAQKLVFVDETGIQEFYYRTHGYSKRGSKIIGKISGKKYERTNIVAGMNCGEIICDKFYKENMDHFLFEDWFENDLLQNIAPGSVVILDNATFHRKNAIRKLVINANCEVVFLPPYSPTLNPIEKKWANLKKFLRTNMKKFKSLFFAAYFYFKTG